MSEAVLRVNHLSIGYGSRCVISDASFTIGKGELVGIIGCNGAGKSTLLKTIRGMLPKQSGEVLFFDKPMEEYTGTRELAEKPVTEVSGGQKQRILLAKVLAQQTPVLFLDEPTTGLDMVYQEEIFRFARELALMGKTVLMVVHELNLAAKYCSRILLLGEGKLLADDTPERVFTEALLSRAYAADIAVSRNPLNNNLEITTRVDEASKEKDAALLKKICCE